MPRVTLLAFAHARDVLGFSEKEIQVDPAATAESLLESLHPGAIAQLPGTRIALDQDYAPWSAPIGDAREIAILPPVSGG